MNKGTKAEKVASIFFVLSVSIVFIVSVLVTASESSDPKRACSSIYELTVAGSGFLQVILLDDFWHSRASLCG